MTIFDKVFGQRKPNTIEVAFGKDRYDIDFAPGSIEDGTITVGDLRSQCTYFTETPAENIRLLFRGKNLANDTVKLNSIGMKSGSKVLCMASKTVLPRTQPTHTSGAQAATNKNTPVVVKSALERLSDLLDVIQRELEPAVVAYTSQIPTDDKERKETHDRLAELLLQKLFALDGITCHDEAPDSEREAVRSQRKDAVKYTQGLLDRVDHVMRDSVVAQEMQEGTTP